LASFQLLILTSFWALEPARPPQLLQRKQQRLTGNFKSNDLGRKEEEKPVC
jgi:hypothetical protein